MCFVSRVTSRSLHCASVESTEIAREYEKGID